MSRLPAARAARTTAPMRIAAALLVAASLALPARAAEPVEIESDVVTDDDRAKAATASAVVAFVGLALGGVLIPGAVSAVAAQSGLPVEQDAFLIAGVVGGTLGAAIGGAIGALPTTTLFAPALVAGAAAGGAVVALAPAALLGSLARAEGAPPINHPLVLAQSAVVVVSIATTMAAAGATGWFFASPDL